MKRLLFLSLLLCGPVWAKDSPCIMGTITDGATHYMGYRKSAFVFKEEKPDNEIARFSGRSWEIGKRKNAETIIRIDQDGDIFLRGKWIAWSATLRKQIKDYREQFK